MRDHSTAPTSTTARHREPLTAQPPRAVARWKWRSLRNAVSIAIAAGATITGISLGLSGPLVSPVTPVVIDAAPAAVAAVPLGDAAPSTTADAPAVVTPDGGGGRGDGDGGQVRTRLVDDRGNRDRGRH